MVKKIAFIVSIFSMTAGATGVPVFDPHGACVYESMQKDFQAIASIKGLEELSADLLDALNKNKSELIQADTSSLHCDPDKDFSKNLSITVEGVGEDNHKSY